MELARIITNGVEVVYLDEGASPSEIQSLNDSGFLNLLRSERPLPQLGKRIVESYREVNGEVDQIWSTINDKSLYQIEMLKAELASSDYKVIKCYEAGLAGSDPPYDIQTLLSERQLVRDRINELELDL